MTDSIDWLPLADAERFMQHHLGLLGNARHQRRRTAIQQFISELCGARDGPDKIVNLSESNVLRWMIEDSSDRDIMVARRRLGYISRFVEGLINAGLLAVDPIDRIRSRFALRGWKHLVPALQSATPHKALAALRPAPASGPLDVLAEEYIAFHRALGKKYYADERLLTRLDRFLQARNVGSIVDVSPRLIEDWYDSLSGNWRTRYDQIGCVARFFTHQVSTKVLSASPVPRELLESRKGLPRTPPFIYSNEQLSGILSHLRQQPLGGHVPWHAETCYVMVLLMYGLGLRHGEALRLCIRDIDLSRQTLFIDRTKFYKSRCLPFGPRVGEALRKFVELRRTILPPVLDDHPLFVAHWRKQMCQTVLGKSFHYALDELGIVGSQGRAPRLHDLRHTFAVHRLMRWYREGIDVQSRLPWLSTFLGHVDIQSTEVYLTITNDLLQHANGRFYENFGRDIENLRST